ncbi:MAG: hypothetical protein WC184_06590 [Acidimicrobiia bacterium]
MSQMGYMYVGWGVSLTVVALYSVLLVLRGRRLSQRVPAEKRRWTS